MVLTSANPARPMRFCGVSKLPASGASKQYVEALDGEIMPSGGVERDSDENSMGTR